jgi:hypothetical protein
MLYRHCFSTLLLEYAIGRVQVNQDGLKLNGIHQLLFYANAVNVLGGSVRASKEIGLKVNADKTKYMFMSRDQNVGQSHSIKTHYSSFERV